MKQFKIYANPLGSYEAIKQGWSWPAFFFGAIWALVKKMWALGSGVLGAFLVFGFIGVVAGGDFEKAIDAIAKIVSIVLAIIFGGYGNKWRETNITSRGFDFKDTVTATNGEDAIAIYVKNNSTNQNS